MNIKTVLQEMGEPVAFARDAHIFFQGDKNDDLYYLQSGLLKAYYISADGKETIKSFIKPGNVIGSLSAAHRNMPCTFNLVALADCEIIKCPLKHVLEASAHSLPLANQLIELLLGLSMKKEQREYEFLTLPADQRFVNFCQKEPELAQVLTQNDIAKYLGITPVALSRIKKRLNAEHT